MSLIGANATANAVGMAPQPGVANYFIGNDPKNWRSGIPTYGKVKLFPRSTPAWIWSSTAISASWSTIS